jgi:hypothetical protein
MLLTAPAAAPMTAPSPVGVQEGEVLRLTASEVALERLQEDMKEQAAAARDREHRQELLLTDKAYLSRQVG